MTKRFLACSVAALAMLAASAWTTPHTVDGSGYDATQSAVEIGDADFCFGPGNQGVGFACNSECYSTPDPSYFGLAVVCPGPPASITFAPAPAAVSCGSQSLLTVRVADARDLPVADDTLVSFSTDGGVVSGSSATSGGLAYATFLVPPKTSGVTHVVASVGSVRAEKRIDVGC
jgi:hypothetical protein